MRKLLKIGIPILVAVLALGIGAGLVLANGDDTPAVTNKALSYQAGYSWCPQGNGANCPQGNGVNCPQAGYCQGYCGGSGDTANQPYHGGCWR